MKNQFIICFILVFSSTNLIAQSCLPEGIEFTSQEQIDSFAINYPGCTEILGDVLINDTIWGAISNLNGLEQLSTVHGDLLIHDNFNLIDLSGLNNLTSIHGIFSIIFASLTDLSGLDNLSSIDGDLEIHSMAYLENISNLSNLNAIGGGLNIQNSFSLTNLVGLENITILSGDLTIKDMALESLTGLNNLQSIAGQVWINYCEELVDLSGLDNVTSMDSSLIISQNNNLESLNGLDNLNTAGRVSIFYNPKLLNATGLGNLNTVDNSLNIYDNSSLENLEGFTALNAIGGLYIADNPVLIDLSGLENVASIGGRVYIKNNSSLINLNGLNGVEIIHGDVKITENPSLVNLSGLDGLETINGFIEVEANPSLVNLTGLDNLTTIDSSFSISNNESLSNLNGLSNLTSIGFSFEIRNNPSLLSLTNFNNLTSISGWHLWIQNNPLLTNLSEFPALTDVGSLWILDNNALTSLTGLASLTTVGDFFNISNNPSLISLEGLENVTTLESFYYPSVALTIKNNALLENLAGLGNADLSDGVHLYIEDNSSLSLCAQANFCNHILGGGNPNISNNAPGCNNTTEILFDCFENLDNSVLTGRIITDLDQNCLDSSGDVSMENWLIEASNGNYSITVSSNNIGEYWLPVLEGEWTLNVISPSSFWAPCFTDTIIMSNALEDTIVTDFLMQPDGDCPFIDWEAFVPNFRICQNSTLVIDYCNYGTQVGEDIIFSVSLDSFLTFQSASIPHTIDGSGNIIFEIDSIDLLECGQFTIDVFLDCDSVDLGDIQCVHVELMPTDLCANDNSTWDGSTIKASGFCENDSIHFELENIGMGNMNQAAQFRVEIIIDDIVLLHEVDDYQLNVGGKLMLSYEIDGHGIRLEADQTPEHPVSGKASVVVPSCDSISNNIILVFFPSNNGDPFSETYCRYAVASYDPNIKTAIPQGLGDMHEIDKSWELDYTVQFQNTGNDTAFLVVLRDTLSEKLDLTTLRVHGGSHPFTWALNPERELVFTFENILLPDSTTNEPESHGFVNFSISPGTDLLPGDIIQNNAEIYFDFNDPIITNTVFHTIRKPIVATSEHIEWCAGDEYMGQLIRQDTMIQHMINFIEYDSIHLVHLDVVSVFQDTVSIDVEIGTYFENILINGDTTFTINYLTQNDCDSLVTYLVGGLTDIEIIANAFKDVKVFPNPANDILTVVNHENNEAQQWSLMDNLGRAVWKQQLNINESLSGIHLAQFPKGVYLLKVKTETATAIWKIIKL